MNRSKYPLLLKQLKPWLIRDVAWCIYDQLPISARYAWFCAYSHTNHLKLFSLLSGDADISIIAENLHLYTNDAAITASNYGRNDVLELFIISGLTIPNEAIVQAIAHGYMDCIELFATHELIPKTYEDWGIDEWYRIFPAAGIGGLEVIQFLYDFGYTSDDDVRNMCLLPSALIRNDKSVQEWYNNIHNTPMLAQRLRAIILGDLIEFKQLTPISDDNALHIEIFATAVEHNRMDIVNHITHNHRYWINSRAGYHATKHGPVMLEFLAAHNCFHPHVDQHYMAACRGRVDSSEWLLARGIAPSQTSWHIACMFDQVDYAKWLLNTRVSKPKVIFERINEFSDSIIKIIATNEDPAYVLPFAYNHPRVLHIMLAIHTITKKTIRQCRNAPPRVMRELLARVR